MVDLANGPPTCSDYADVMRRAADVINSKRSVSDLSLFIDEGDGIRFDQEVDREFPNEFTEKDFRAVGRLSVSVLKTAREWLLNEGRAEVRELLEGIPPDLDLWNVEPSEYCAQLGSDSSAWKLWRILNDLQKGARHAGRGVTAGKLLHGKRPRFIPIYDDAGIGAVLGVTQDNIWEAMWCVMRDPEIRRRVEEIRSAVPKASDLSILRVLDIVAWKARTES